MKLYAVFALLGSGGLAAAFGQSDIHACEAAPEPQQLYDAAKSSLDRVKLLREALAKYPNDLFLNRWLLASPQIRSGALAGEYRAKLDAHPADPKFLYLYGQSLIGRDTPNAVDFLRQALAKDPELTYAHWALLEVYSSLNFRDSAKTVESIRAFAVHCPTNVDVYQYTRYVEDPAALRELAAMFRRTVENRNTVGVASVYPNLWTAEFRLANPKDFEQLRARVRKDMGRIRQLDPADTNQSRSLAQGYKLLGDTATAESLQAKRTPAKTYLSDHKAWTKEHPDYRAEGASGELLSAADRWVKDWPGEVNVWHWRMLGVAWKKDASAADIEKAGETLLAMEARNFSRWTPYPESLHVAELWEENDIRLPDCIRLARRAIAEMSRTPQSNDDRRSIDFLVTNYQQENGMGASLLFGAYGIVARAARKLEDFAAADVVVAEMKAWFDSHPGNYLYPWDTYHREAAQLAEAEKRKPDALVHYQLAQHDAKSEAHALELWKQSGGTAEAFDLFWKRPLEWTKIEKPLTALHAPDLSGKTWTIADLKGKTTLINVWATWCGPCRDELPQVQKLYEQTKDRKDIQIITISTDENPGLLPPFMQKEHYAFPVLSAKALVDDLLREVSIPRTWIVDPTGVIRAERVGFFAGDWPDGMLAKWQEAR